MNNKDIFIIGTGFLAAIALIIIWYVQRKWKDEETRKIEAVKVFCSYKKIVVPSSDICEAFKDLGDIPLDSEYRTCFWCFNAQLINDKKR